MRVQIDHLKYPFQKKVKVLAYHSVCKTPPNKYSVSVDQFIEQLEYLQSNHYNVISVDQLLPDLRNNQIQSKAVVITFDDGYCSLIENALPLLHKYKFPCTIFIPFDFIGKGDGFSYKNYRPDLPILSIGDINDIRTNYPLVTIGSHSMKHRDLTSLDENSLRYEINDSFKFLQKNFKEEIYTFAYPYGMFNEFIKKIVAEAGYDCAFAFGNIFSNTLSTNRFELKREIILNNHSLKTFTMKVNPRFDIIRKILKIG